MDVNLESWSISCYLNSFIDLAKRAALEGGGDGKSRPVSIQQQFSPSVCGE